jgi:hypothetical protein
MFVVVDTHTKCKVRHPRTRKETYASERAARAAATRISKIQDTLGSFVVMDVASYKTQVPMVEVMNLMTGQTVLEHADTPWHCSVASESYWSN